MSYDFVNPYNFFPLGSVKAKAKKNNKEQLSGVIRYSLYTKTPLIIPDVTKAFIQLVDEIKDNRLTGKKKAHEHYVFMSLQQLTGFSGKVEELNESITQPEQPFIPGSQVRGMFRSVYELLTDSCLSVLNDDNILSKRTHEVFKAGLLYKNEDGNYTLYSADDCIFRADETGSVKNAGTVEGKYIQNSNTGAYEYRDAETKSYRIDAKDHDGNFHEGQKIYFLRKERSNGKYKSTAKNLSLEKNDYSPDTGYLLKGMAGPTLSGLQEKHNCHIFSLTEKSAVIQSDVNISILETVLKMYKENGEDAYEEYARCFKEYKKSTSDEYFPVYYSELAEGRNRTPGKVISVFLSPAAITREIYTNRIKNSSKTFTPCKESASLCPACSLFGTVNAKNAVGTSGFSSKLRFSDLLFTGSEQNGNRPDYRGAVTLVPMSTPKISNMEFYLKRPSEDAVFWTYDYYVTVDGRIVKNDAEINGRKFYWHHTNLLTVSENEKSDQNKTVYPLDSGNSFAGELYFDKISKDELDYLIFILNCDEGDEIKLRDRTHGYKLGSGKPAGLGSVAVKVDSVFVRNISEEASDYTVAPYTASAPEIKHTDKFKKMTLFDGNGNVDYPKTKAGGDIFEWFSSNHKGVNRNKNNDAIEANRSGRTLLDMPNNRRSEVFLSYMEAMKPELADVSVLKPFIAPSTEQKKNFGESSGKKRFDESKFIIGKQYVAVFKNTYTAKNEKEYANITVDGESASVPARVLPWNIRSGDTFRVRYDGMSGIHPKFFVIR